MLATVNNATHDESYKVKTLTEQTYEEEEGEFASSDSPSSKLLRKRSGNKNFKLCENYLYIAPLPSFCKVNPNLPHCETNQQESIVRGIERVSEGVDDFAS